MDACTVSRPDRRLEQRLPCPAGQPFPSVPASARAIARCAKPKETGLLSARATTWTWSKSGRLRSGPSWPKWLVIARTYSCVCACERGNECNQNIIPSEAFLPALPLLQVLSFLSQFLWFEIQIPARRREVLRERSSGRGSGHGQDGLAMLS